MRKCDEGIIPETIMTSKSLTKIRRTQKLDQDRLITLLDKQGREIHDQDNFVQRIEEFYTELYDSEQSTINHTDPRGTRDNILGGGSSTMRYEEWDNNRQRPYQHRSTESRKYHLEDIC